MVDTVMLAEATKTASSFDITSILQFGLLGLIFLCLVFRRFIVPEWTLTSAETRAVGEKADLAGRVAELQEQVTRLQTAYQDLIIPALTRSTEINATYLEELQRTRIGRGQ
jgi:hypothetical protein